MDPLPPDGLGSGAIRLVPYDPAWPAHFREIESELSGRLGSLLHTAHHIGSTAIPGLAAKPKIDVDAVIDPGERLAEAVATMRATPDWAFHGDPYGDGMWTFTRGRGSWGARLYLCAPATAAHERRILFRDYLRAHPARAAAYEALKRRLAVEADGDWSRYTGGKAGFVNETVGLAEDASTPRLRPASTT